MQENVRGQEPPKGVMAALQVIGGKWKPLILFILLREGTKRFGELRRMLPNVTQGMLAHQLRELERDGLVVRRVYPEIPPKVEYELSVHGHSLQAVLNELCGWGLRHLEFLADGEAAEGKDGEGECEQRAAET